MNRRGHIIFAIGILIFAIYIVKPYISVSYPFLLLHLPLFLVGTVTPDVLEKPSFGNVWHRSFFHSKVMLMLLIFFLIPISVYLSIYNLKSFIFNINYNYWSFISSFLFGWCSHLMGDSLTSRLR